MINDGLELWGLLDRWRERYVFNNGEEYPTVDMVRDLFRRVPEAARYRGIQGQSLTHRCLDQRIGFRRRDLLRLLVESDDPGCLLREDAVGLLPIHVALLVDDDARSLPPSSIADTVRLLVELCPESLAVELCPESFGFAENDPIKGRLPLHWACGVRRELETIKVLVDAYPPAVDQHPDNSGRYPLHWYLNGDYWSMTTRITSRKSLDVNTVLFLLDRGPTVLANTVPDAEDGYLPLHSAVAGFATMGRHRYAEAKERFELVRLLADRYPRALSMQARSGLTPLALACRLAGYDADSDGYEEEDSDDEGDLELIEASAIFLSLVYTLVRQWPEQVVATAEGGMTRSIFTDNEYNGELEYPALASKSIRLKRVEAWSRLHGDSELLSPPVTTGEDTTTTTADRDTDDRRLPLHYAVVSKSCDAVAIVRHLVDAAARAPDGDVILLSRADRYGRLPLHYAAACNASREIITVLIDRFPDGLATVDREGRLPWHYGQCANGDLGDMMYERTLAENESLDLDFYLVPDEIRWDLVQSTPELRALQ